MFKSPNRMPRKVEFAPHRKRNVCVLSEAAVVKFGTGRQTEIPVSMVSVFT